MIVDLHVESRSILIIGGGRQATRKAEAMLREGALVTVVSPQFSATLEEMARDKRLKIIQKTAADDNTLLEAHPDILVAATDDIALNARLVELAKSLGILAYNASSPRNSDYSHVAVAEIDDIIKVGVSTGGKSPVMAKAIRDTILAMLKRTVTEEMMMHLKDEGVRRDLRRDCVEMTPPQGMP